MYPEEKTYYDIENPVVRDELWDDGYDDDEWYYCNGRWGRDEPDWDKMPGGHDYYDD